jgi:uncharacterized repeat protein (TIGR04138 family)
MSQQQQTDWDAMRQKAGPYPIEAFNFVRDGLTFTLERLHNERLAPTHSGSRCMDETQELQSLGADHHISGQQLCLGLRDFAIDQYGLLAPAVLEHWFIKRTEDFGRIVFAMVDAELMSSTDEDSIEDFRSVYHFSEAFSRNELLSHITATS